MSDRSSTPATAATYAVTPRAPRRYIRPEAPSRADGMSLSPLRPASARPSAAATALAAATVAAVATKDCPECEQEVRVAARVCKHCRHRFAPPPGVAARLIA